MEEVFFFFCFLFVCHLATASGRWRKLPVVLGFRFNLRYFLWGFLFLLHILKSLGLSSNFLEEIPLSIYGLFHLKRLDLQENRIKFVDHNIGCLTKLQKLFLGGNQIMDVSDTVGSLTSLRRLDLRKNRISMLAPSVWAVSSKVLQLEGNPLQVEIDEEVRFQGKDVISQHLLEWSKGELIWPFVKLLVVGEEAAGKTFLLKKLGGKSSHDGLSTDGVQVSQVKIASCDSFLFKAYDFGGQEVFC
jgi:hypothetical protein